MFGVWKMDDDILWYHCNFDWHWLHIYKCLGNEWHISRFTSWWGWQQRWNATFLDQQLSQTGWTLSLRWHRFDNRMSKSKSPPWSSSSLRFTTNIINSNTLFASSSTSMLASAICFSYFRENQPYFAILLKLFPNVFQHLSWMKSFKSTRETLSKVESDSFYFP